MRLIVLALLALTLAACDMTPTSQQAKDEGFTPLFNGKDFTGFYTYLQTSGKNNDPNHIFKIENGMIHIMDLPESTQTQETGYFATEKEYGNFDLKLEYKWGTKRWAPRATLPRDSGVHYFLTGPDKVWANALECQIQEGETGDLYNLNSAYTMTTFVKSATEPTKTFLGKDAGGVPWTHSASRLQRSQTVDSATAWNTVEIIVKNNTATHIVNGTIVNHVDNVTTKAGVPLTQGKIAFQSEAAEMWFRNIQIKVFK